MKRVLFISSLCLLLLSSFRNEIADEGNEACKAYFPTEIGTILTYEHFNAKDKLEGISSFSVTDLIETGAAMTIKIHMSYQDAKGKEAYQSDFEYVCEDGVFKMSLDNMFPQEMMDGMEGMEMEFTQSEIQIPSTMSVGQTLAEAQMTMKASMNGIEIMTMKMDITDRKVEAQESMTTAAGSFECYKLSQTTTSKMVMMETTYSTMEWYAPNIGSVRSERYDEKGNLEAYSVLTNIQRQ